MPQPADRLICAATGNTTFAMFPELGFAGFPAGPIVLKYGKHLGGSRGYGFQHIWREHYPRIADHDVAQNVIIGYVSSILVTNAPIYYEAGSRVAVFKASAGQVIVELRGAEYSVVTAYASRNAKGSWIGALA